MTTKEKIKQLLQSKAASGNNTAASLLLKLKGTLEKPVVPDVFTKDPYRYPEMRKEPSAERVMSAEPVREKPTTLQRAAEYIKPKPEVRPMDIYRELPGAFGQVATGAVGAVTGLAGGIIGGIETAIMEMGKQVYKEGKSDPKKLWQETVKGAVSTAKLGYEAGRTGAQVAPITPVLAPLFTYAAGKGIINTFIKIGEIYEKNKMEGDKNPTLRAAYEGSLEGSSQGWQLIGADKQLADEISKNEIIAGIGNFLLYGAAVLGTFKTASQINTQANKLPFLKVKPTGNSIVIPADMVDKLRIINKLKNTEFRTITTVDGVEIISAKLNKIPYEQITQAISKLPPRIKGNFVIIELERTPWGRALKPISKIFKKWIWRQDIFQNKQQSLHLLHLKHQFKEARLKLHRL